jgi:hypothetical protein
VVGGRASGVGGRVYEMAGMLPPLNNNHFVNIVLSRVMRCHNIIKYKGNFRELGVGVP